MEAAKNLPTAPGLSQAPPFDKELATRRFSMMCTLARWAGAACLIGLLRAGQKVPRKAGLGAISRRSAGTPYIRWGIQQVAPRNASSVSVLHKIKG